MNQHIPMFNHNILKSPMEVIFKIELKIYLIKLKRIYMNNIFPIYKRNTFISVEIPLMTYSFNNGYFLSPF